MPKEDNDDELGPNLPDSRSMLGGPTDAQHVLRAIPVASAKRGKESSSEPDGGE